MVYVQGLFLDWEDAVWTDFGDRAIKSATLSRKTA